MKLVTGNSDGNKMVKKKHFVGQFLTMTYRLWYLASANEPVSW